MKKITFLRNLIVLVALLIGSGSAMGGTHITEGFSTTSLPSGWSGDVYFNTTANIGNLSGGNGAGFNASNKYLQLPSVNSAGTLTFWIKGSAASSQISLRVEMSVGGGSFTTIAEFPKPHTTTAVQKTVDINNSSNNIILKFVAYDRTGNSIYLDDIVLTDYIACTASNLAFDSPTTVEKLADDVNFIKTATSLNETTAIVYSSSDTDVATVNSSTGEVDILAAGTTTITATQAAGTHSSVDYCAGEVTYTLNVAPVDPTITVTEETVPAMSAYVDASDSKTITVNGLNLTTDITLALSGADPTQFRLSTSTLTQTDGSVTDASVTIYYEPTTFGSHAATLTLSSTGADDVTKTLSGTATWAPLAAPVATAAGPVSQTAFTANWNAVAGATEYELTVSTKEGDGASDLFISEYIEGGSSNKAIEIFNGTGASVDLSGYKVELFSNGASTATNTLDLTGTLANNDVYVVYNSSANTAIKAAGDVSSSVANFNGDDAVALYKISTSSYVDIFGKIGEQPSTAWTDGDYSTMNKTLVRKSTVTGGVTVNPASGFPTLATEWDLYNQDYSDDLGSHTFTGGVTLTEILGSPFTVVGTSRSFSGLNEGGTFVYTVKAKNANVTSAVSNEIEVAVAGISVGTDNPSTLTSIYAHNAKIHFAATAGEKVEVYNAVGQKIISTLATDGQNELSVNAKGVMIVKVGSRLAKVIL